MNISTIALCLLAWKMLKPNNSPAKDNIKDSMSIGDISSLLSDDAKNIIDNISTLTDKDADKTGALIGMITNPTIMTLFGNMFGGLFGGGKANDNNTYADKPIDTATHEDSEVADDDMASYYGGTSASHDFFQPLGNIAGKEVSSKLYHIYDNWYGRG